MDVNVLAATGSSPHAWGPLEDEVYLGHVLGIIPTRVGTTASRRRTARAGWDHPHTRGDHCLCGSRDRRGSGSSPHAWGPPAGRRHVPRPPGSSPHAWGPRLGELRVVVHPGIIPTRVGTTRGVPASTGCAWDHPHTRGDHAVRACSRMDVAGSSPHAWGPPCRTHPSRGTPGIIPTRVGTTRPVLQRIPPRRDHPHTRGDHDHVRPEAEGREGIIPTRVGTTPRECGRRTPRRDHPHTRGDHRKCRRCDPADPGSSPHAWGPLDISVPQVYKAGIIPTRVGTTRRRGRT